MNIFDILSWPFAWVLTFLYLAFKNYGLTLIVFTILIRICLLPLGIKQQKTSLLQVKYQPKIKEIQDKYKNNKVKMNEEMQKLYQEEGYNPLGGCLPMLIQLPIILILYNIITRPLTNICGMTSGKIQQVVAALNDLGITVSSKSNQQIQLARVIHENKDALSGVLPANYLNIDFNFIGIDLSQIPKLKELSPLLLIPILAALTGFLVGYISQKYSAVQAQGSMKALMYMSPLLSLFYAFIFPAGVGLYWIMSNITSALQSLYLGNKYNPKEYAEKIKAEEEERKKKQKQEIKDKRAAKFGNTLPENAGNTVNKKSDIEEEEQKDD